MSTNQSRSLVNTPMWVDIFLKNKIDPTLIPLLISQIILESGWYGSNAYNLDNNPGGITWSSKYLNRPGTSKGRPRKEGGYYVRFENFDAAAKDYIRVISQKYKANFIGRPIDQRNIDDYAHALKLNDYYVLPKDWHVYANTMKSVAARNQQWNDVATLLKKNSSLNMAGLNPVFILIILSYFFFKK